jgi:hypothetical protein
MKHVAPPPAIELLAQAIEELRPHVDPSLPIVERARNFWAAISAARDLGAVDVIAQDFLQLAHGTGLVRELGLDAVHHLIRWGLLDRNPFYNGRRR